MKELIPRLAGRLSRSYPELGVKRFRLRVRGEDLGARALPPADPAPLDPAPRQDPRTGPGMADAAPPAERLEALASRYLDKSRNRGNY